MKTNHRIGSILEGLAETRVEEAAGKKKMSVPEVPEFYKTKTGKWKGAKGTFYWLDKKLSLDDKKALMNKYSNIVLLNSQSEYAPEQVSMVIFVADKALSVSEE